MGIAFLALLIFIAGMVTAVGLTCACLTTCLSHTAPCCLCWGASPPLVSNLGLSHLIQLSIPVLTPPCIVLVLLSLTLNWWNSASRIVIPTMLNSLLFGMIDGIKSSALASILPEWSLHLPLAEGTGPRLVAALSHTFP